LTLSLNMWPLKVQV